jgi:HSP20 family molecular chaperone IbpA
MVEPEVCLHKGIAARKFTDVFTLAEFVEVVVLILMMECLNIVLEKQIPEEKNQKQSQSSSII